MTKHTATACSRDRVPSAAWLRSWLAALLVAGVALGTMEWFWREQGHRPSVVDNPDLWAYYRRQVDASDKTVVLLGSSRIQLGFSTGTFRDRFVHYRLLQLAVDGRSPVPMLRDLAMDERFRGVVICAISARALEPRTPDQQPYLDHEDQSTLNNRLNSRMTALIQHRLAVINPQVHLLNTAIRFGRTRTLPKPSYLVTHEDRSRSADYRLVDIEAYRQRRLDRDRGVYQDAADGGFQPWLGQSAQVESWVRRIQDRGGKVAFVRFPTAGAYHAMDEADHPKARYWDRFAAMTSAEAIHFQEEPTLSGFDCPDGSHLDYRDAPRFTEALADELVRRGVLADSPGKGHRSSAAMRVASDLSTRP